MGANAGEDLLKVLVKAVWLAIKGLYKILTFVFRWAYKKYQEKKNQTSGIEQAQTAE
jgi:hypothetical protein